MIFPFRIWKTRQHAELDSQYTGTFHLDSFQGMPFSDLHSYLAWLRCAVMVTLLVDGRELPTHPLDGFIDFVEWDTRASRSYQMGLRFQLHSLTPAERVNLLYEQQDIQIRIEHL